MNNDIDTESREKEIFDEMQEKQANLAKRILFGVFVGMGVLFAALGIVFWVIIKELAIVFLAMGLFMVALGVILFFVIPTKYNYEKYKMRVQKYGLINTFEIHAKIVELEARIEELEKGDRS